MRNKTSKIIYTNVTKQQTHLTAAIKYSIIIQTDLRRKEKKNHSIHPSRQLLKAADKLTVFHFKLKVLFLFFNAIFVHKGLLLFTCKENTTDSEYDFSSFQLRTSVWPKANHLAPLAWHIANANYI